MTATFIRHTDKLVDLYIDGEVISTTGEHPFWTPDKGWVEAKNLEVGSLLKTEDGRIIDVDKIEQREGNFTVYNFTVEGFYTYFVSELGILVHNTYCDDYRDPVQDAVEHIMKDHPQRLRDFGLRDAAALQDFLDDLYNKAPEVWFRADNNTTAYVDPTKGMFIDNPARPTIIAPREDYVDYLLTDGFIRL